MINETTKANAQGVYDYLIMNPDKHDQDLWVKDEDGLAVHNPSRVDSCGTTMCIAGATAYLYSSAAEFNRLIQGETATDMDRWIRVGMRHLGLTRVQASQLFFVMDNETALDMLNAVANGDAKKFRAIRNEHDADQLD